LHIKIKDHKTTLMKGNKVRFTVGSFRLGLRSGLASWFVCIALLSTAIFPCHGQGILVRKEVSKLHPNELASLRKAVAKMKSLPPEHPFSWSFQANIHGTPGFPSFVTQVANSAQADPHQRLFSNDPTFTPSHDVFNQCPHGGIRFLPWHRAYLYYFERILRWAAEDPNLTLPYWNYYDSTLRNLPAAVAHPVLADGGHNPLFVPSMQPFRNGMAVVPFPGRSLFVNLGLAPATDDQVDSSALNEMEFSGGFLNTGFSNALEQLPHNVMHGHLGGQDLLNQNSGLSGFMSSTSTAARDPIFWLHHANIDRSWDIWLALGNGRTNPTNPALLNHEVRFYDVGGDGAQVPVTKTLGEFMTSAALGYSYDTLELMDSDAEIVIAANGEGHMEESVIFTSEANETKKADTDAGLASVSNGEESSVASHGHGAVKDGKVTIRRGSGAKVNLNATGGTGRRMLAGAGGIESSVKTEIPDGLVLELRGVHLSGAADVSFGIYVNIAGSEKPKAGSPHLVGVLTFFGSDHHGMKMGGHGESNNIKRFALSKVLRRIASAGDLDRLSIQILPLGRSSALAGADAETATVEEVRILKQEPVVKEKKENEDTDN
jgi:hypothetical protein